MFTITDTEVNPSSVLSFKGVRVDSNYAMAACVCELLTIHSDETRHGIEIN